MQDTVYFVFSLNDQLYGIDRNYVEEVFLLPEFVPIPKAPSYIVGGINLRGSVLLLMDLNATPDKSLSDYCLTDKVVVLKCPELKIGLIVNKIHDEVTVTPHEVTIQALDESVTVSIQPKLVAGIVSRSTDTLMLLKNPEDWVRSQELSASLNTVETSLASLIGIDARSNRSEAFLEEYSVLAQQTTAQERNILRRRADSLRQPLEREDLEGFKPIAVIALAGHVWGIDLDNVREFIDVRSVTPIPCCPKRIVGNINHRGEILTLIDVREALSLPPQERLNSLKAIVVECDDIVAGIMVDAVYEAMFLLNPQHLSATQATSGMQNHYLQGTTFYGSEMMGILNLPKLLLSPELRVDEAVQ